jgi:hypothetical protein
LAAPSTELWLEGRVVVLVDLDITDAASLIVWEAIRYGLKTHRSPNPAVFIGVKPRGPARPGAETLAVLASITDTVRARTARWLWASPLAVPAVRRWLGGVPATSPPNSSPSPEATT